MKLSLRFSFFFVLCLLVLLRPAFAEKQNSFSEASGIVRANNSSVSESVLAEQALSECLIDATTEADKSKMMKMMFSAMTRNPELRGLSNIDSESSEKISQDAGKVIESLLLDKCLNQTHRVMRVSGFDGVGNSFEKLHYPLFYGLLKHPDVESAAGDFVKYMDAGRIEREFGGY